MMKPSKTVTFGEIMGRLCPPGFDRIGQAMPGSLETTFAGAEANVAVSIAYLGGAAAFVTALPKHAVAEACVADLQKYGVDVSGIIRTNQGRLGLYFVERGANQRPSRVIYDRDASSVSLLSPEAYDWDALFRDASWFHFTGITPALSANAAACCRLALEKAREHGLTVSCDLNFREKLWRWEREKSSRELAREVMSGLLPMVDLVIANEADAADVLDIRPEKGDAEHGELEIAHYPEVAARIAGRFEQVSRVAITLRESVSASHNNWGAMLYEKESGHSLFAPVDESGSYQPYPIRQIVDRVGAGDSFAGALIHALQSDDYAEPGRALGFAVAASCLAHSIEGDFNLNRLEEIESLMGGNVSGRVVR